jgi:uncharacterized membrane protein
VSAPRLERVIEAALTAGVLSSGALLLAGLLLDSPRPLVWGIVLLMATPVVRVAVVTVGLLKQRDWLFAAVSAWVLAVLLSGIWVAGRTAPSSPAAQDGQERP